MSYQNPNDLFAVFDQEDEDTPFGNGEPINELSSSKNSVDGKSHLQGQKRHSSHKHKNGNNDDDESHRKRQKSINEEIGTKSTISSNSNDIKGEKKSISSLRSVNIASAFKPIDADSFEVEAQKEYKFESDGLVSQPSAQKDVTTEADQKSLAMNLTHKVRHQVSLPPDYPYIPINQHVSPAKPARTYPFTLDPFQQVSISSIERNESVLVSAHTSAGKTVVAEYAIATALRDKQRVIYTSPIKALSNQKYRELLAEFNDVGLMTGDVTINPSASCLVMTTEILRSMLYRGSEVMREVAWVIFDEIHYMRDISRGVVWEETIILLPDSVRYVFLSATIPNAKQFADWICKLHNQPCHVVYTDFRPTPLQHYLFPQGGDGIHLVVDEKSTFREENFQRATSALVESDPLLPHQSRSRGKKGQNRKDKSTGKGPSDLYKIIKMIMQKSYHPVIVFSFSKRECEAFALQISKLDFNDEDEKKMIHDIFNNALHSLSDDDKQLPQIEHILPLLKRGIGIHHGGLLPILKEVIEILFQEGLLKVLFATETFSIGLNMPAKTVVFTAVRKFDGKETRWLTGGEYIQMSGRAGRRGLDDRGIVILMIDEKIEPAIARSMLKGETDRLNSAFHLGYNMILNLLRVEEISPEYMLERCFFQFQNAADLPRFEQKQRELEAAKGEISIVDEESVSSYHDLSLQIADLEEDYFEVISHPSYILPYLNNGRLVSISITNENGVTQNFGWGVLINFTKQVTKKPKGPDMTVSADPPKYIVDVLLYCDPTSGKDGQEFRPCPLSDEGEMLLVPCSLSSLREISSIRVFTPNNVIPSDSRMQVLRALKEVIKRFPDGIPVLDPVNDMGIHDASFVALKEKIEFLRNRLAHHEFTLSSDTEDRLSLYKEKLIISKEIKSIRKKITQANQILQMDELKHRKRVLRRLGYISSSDVVELKGRVACEISAGDELLLTELMFNGVFNELDVNQTVALLCCFVTDEKTESQSRLSQELAGPLRLMQESARRIAKVSIESKIIMDEEEYVSSFRPELMDVAYAWSKGAKFAQICKMTDIFEGSIIRVFRRLEELLRQMCVAAKSIGNTELEAKFSEGIARIKRDIIFAASLYL